MEAEAATGPAKTAAAGRITVALTPKAAAALERVQDRTRLSKTDIANRALPLYDLIDAALGAGSEVLVRDRAGNVASVYLL